MGRVTDWLALPGGGGTLITEMLARLFCCILLGRTGEFLCSLRGANPLSHSLVESLSHEHKAEAPVL